VRERILWELRVGKQSPEYKPTKAVMNRFIAVVTQPQCLLRIDHPIWERGCAAGE